MLTGADCFGRRLPGPGKVVERGSGMGGLKWVPRCFTSTLHSWPQSPFSVTLSRDGLALESCESQSSVEELLLSPGGSRTFGSGGLALAWLTNPPFLSATQPVPPATGPKPLFMSWLCWAQGFEPDFRRDRNRSPCRMRLCSHLQGKPQGAYVSKRPQTRAYLFGPLFSY